MLSFFFFWGFREGVEGSIGMEGLEVKVENRGFVLEFKIIVILSWY